MKVASIFIAATAAVLILQGKAGKKDIWTNKITLNEYVAEVIA